MYKNCDDIKKERDEKRTKMSPHHKVFGSASMTSASRNQGEALEVLLRSQYTELAIELRRPQLNGTGDRYTKIKMKEPKRSQ